MQHQHIPHCLACAWVRILLMPHPDIVYAYIEQFKRHSEFKSDKAVAQWLGMRGNNAERNLRAFKTGESKPPFGIWRRLLVATGRVPQEIIPVIAFMR